MKRTKIFISIALFFAIVLSCIPLSVFANEVAEPEITEAEPTNSELTLYDSYTEVTDDIIGAVNEVTELREENVKHFSLPNGTYEAVSYGQAVHRKDSDGVWQDINNDLTLTTVGTKEIYSTPDSRLSFDKGSNALTLSENGYSIYMSLLSRDDGNMSMTTEPMNIEVVNGYENRPEYYDTLEEAIEVNNRSSITYSNVMNGTDIEYVMNGNDIKENIIVKTKKDSYEYGFMLALHGLVPILENNVIILKDETTNEEKYIIPAPYMYDSNDMYSYDVEYGLIHAGGEKYLLTVTADEEWINDEERAWPVTIDPTLQSTSDVWDTKIDEYTPDDNYGTRSTMSLLDISQCLVHVALPLLPLGAVTQRAELYMKYYNGTISENITLSTQVYQITGSWSETEVTYDNRPSTAPDSLSNVSLVLRNDLSYNSPATVSYSISDAVIAWYNGSPNYGVNIRTSGEVLQQATFKTRESGDSPYLAVTYTHYFEDGVYAFQSAIAAARWMRIEHNSASNGAVAGNNLQHMYSATSPIQAYVNPENDAARSSLFKITRVGLTDRYIIRSMLNNRLSIGLVNDEIVTKEIPSDDSRVSANDTFRFVWNGNGFTIRSYNSVNSNNTYEIAISSTSDPDLIPVSSTGTGTNATWNMVKYTNNHRYGFELHATPDWDDCGVVKGEQGSAKLIGWSTYTGVNTLSMYEQAQEVDRGSIVWDSSLDVMTLTPEQYGDYIVRAYIGTDASGISRLFKDFVFPIIPANGLYCFKNGAEVRYIGTENGSTNVGTTVQQAQYDGTNAQRWAIQRVAGQRGYVHITSYKGLINGVERYVGIDSTDDSKVKLFDSSDQNGDLALWKFEWVESAKNKIICKNSIGTNKVLAPYFDEKENASAALTQVEYDISPCYYDVWIVHHIKAQSRVTPVYDNAYVSKNPDAVVKILQQLCKLQEFYVTEFAILINISIPSSFSSHADRNCTNSLNQWCTCVTEDECVNSYRNGNQLVSFEYHHTNMYNMLLNIPVPDLTETLKIAYTGHKLCQQIENPDTGELEHADGALGLTNFNLGLAIIQDHGDVGAETDTLIHEFGHLYGTLDHYGGVFPTTDEMNAMNNTQAYNSECMYGEGNSFDIFGNPNLCEGCKNIIISNINIYNHD